VGYREMSKEDEELADGSPYEGKIQREAFVAGFKQGRKRDGQERDQHPRKFGNQKTTIECWRVGWDRGRAELREEIGKQPNPLHPAKTIAESLPGTATRVVGDGPSQVRGHEPGTSYKNPKALGIDPESWPNKTRAEPPNRHPNTFWPEGKPFPRTYQKRPQVPCPQCRRILLDDLGQAVVCKCTANGKAYLECRGCGNRFELALEP
jgi:hypothetical protein